VSTLKSICHPKAFLLNKLITSEVMILQSLISLPFTKPLM